MKMQQSLVLAAMLFIQNQQKKRYQLMFAQSATHSLQENKSWLMQADELTDLKRDLIFKTSKNNGRYFYRPIFFKIGERGVLNGRL